MARVRGVLACLVALSLWGGISLNASAGYAPAGFAIWPEDNEPAGTAACASRGQDEAWRTNREETAKQFVREELGWPSPVLYTDAGTDSPSRLVIGDEEPKGVFLGIVLEMYRYGECWYVTHIWPREGDLGSVVGFTEVAGETNLLLRAFGWENSLMVDVGYGEENEFPVESGQQVLLPVENETETGHFFAYREDQPSEMVGGLTLPVPMDPLSVEPSSARGGYAIWPFHFFGPSSGAKRYCRRDFMHDPERVVKTFVREELGGGVKSIERQDRAHWIVEVDGAHFRVVLRHVQQDCWPVKRVKSLGRAIGATIRMAEDRYTIDFEWGDAVSAGIDLNYGGNWDGASIERIEGPFTEPMTYDISRPGSYLVTLTDADGRLVGVEGSKLGPVTD